MEKINLVCQEILSSYYLLENFLRVQFRLNNYYSMNVRNFSVFTSP